MINIDKNEIQKLYIAYFGRPGDPNGINYWYERYNKFLTLREISNQLSLQDEYQIHVIVGKSIEFQVNQLYINLFGRKVDFDGLNYWLRNIEMKKYSISDVVYEIIWGFDKLTPINSGQLKKDIEVLSNKIYAAELFTNEISKKRSLINLYQPESIKPWISGNTLVKASNFLDNIIFQKVSKADVDFAILSLSERSIGVLNRSAIEIKNVNLFIPVYSSESRSLTKRLTKKVVNLTGGALAESRTGTNIIALNNINLRIMSGERVALIGHNGSGKSSFLRLISGIYKPTNGTINISADVYPMLQKAFLTSSELTGVDACKAHYLLNNYNLKGFDGFLSEIIEFSGLGSFISFPIKTYSDGMSARLIFSILTSSPHDCLAIDEGFGTGDADFFERAEKRLKKFMDSAATLFLASHSEELLKQFCDRGIVFSHGSIVYDNSLDAALNYYHTHDYYHKNVIK